MYFRVTPLENPDLRRAAMALKKAARGCKRAKTRNKPAMTNTTVKRHGGSAQDKIDKVRGLEVTIVTSARTDQEGRRLLELFGMPFQRAA